MTWINGFRVKYGGFRVRVQRMTWINGFRVKYGGFRVRVQRMTWINGFRVRVQLLSGINGFGCV
jgi:ribosome modulation factor